MEQRNKLAFWGVQVKYSYSRLLLLYGAVLAGMTGMYLFRVMETEKTYGAGTFIESLQKVPLYLSFLALVLGSQVILSVAYAKQERDYLAMARMMISSHTVWRIRFAYSMLLTIAAFMVHFITVFLLFFIERLLHPEYAKGIVELYPVFYRFCHLYLVYPVVNSWAVWGLVLCIVAVSQIAVMIACRIRYGVSAGVIFAFGLACSFISFTCAGELISLVLSGGFLAFLASYAIWNGRRLHKRNPQGGAGEGDGGGV